jgi:hypothetical protein
MTVKFYKLIIFYGPEHSRKHVCRLIIFWQLHFLRLLSCLFKLIFCVSHKVADLQAISSSKDPQSLVFRSTPSAQVRCPTALFLRQLLHIFLGGEGLNQCMVMFTVGINNVLVISLRQRMRCNLHTIFYPSHHTRRNGYPQPMVIFHVQDGWRLQANECRWSTAELAQTISNLRCLVEISKFSKYREVCTHQLGDRNVGKYMYAPLYFWLIYSYTREGGPKIPTSMYMYRMDWLVQQGVKWDLCPPPTMWKCPMNYVTRDRTQSLNIAVHPLQHIKWHLRSFTNQMSCKYERRQTWNTIHNSLQMNYNKQ